MIKLYIGGQPIDIDNNIQIEMTYKSMDISKPQAIKNSFSKSIDIKGTPNNNNVFGQLWRLDRTKHNSLNIASGFDARKRVDFTITKYGAIIDSGYIQLNNIKRTGQDITYNITLYGGLGDFFYNLMFNEDGNEKKLSDLYWHWKPRFTKIKSTRELTKEQEDNNVLINWNSEVLASGWQEVLFNKSVNNFEFTDITEDITVIPIYKGKYDDFENDKILVDDNLQWGPNAIAPDGIQLPSYIKDIYESKIPNIKTIDNVGYTTKADKFYPAHSYGRITASREMEPFEARDLRCTKLNIGLRFQKFLDVISNPENNGGFNVEIDEDILNTPYYKYSWLMLSTPDWEQGILGNQAQTSGSAISFVEWDEYPNNTSVYIDPMLELNPEINVRINIPYFYYYWTGEWKEVVDSEQDQTTREEFVKTYYWPNSYQLYNYYQWGDYIGWTGTCQIYEIYDDTTLYSREANLIHCGLQNSDGEPQDFGYTFDGQYIQAATIKTAIVNKLETQLGYSLNNPQTVLTNYGIVSSVNSSREPRKCKIDNYYKISNEPYLKFSGAVPASENLQVKITYIKFAYIVNKTTNEVVVFTDLDDQSSNYQYFDHFNLLFGPINYYGEYPPEFAILPNNTSLAPDITGQPIRDIVSTGYYLDKSKVNQVYNADKYPSGEVTKIATKNTLFSTSDTPYKYLTDFTKILNLKYLYDNISKTVKIMPRYKYYKNEVVDLTVDYNKDIIIDPVITDHKYKEFALPVVESWADYLYQKKYKQPFASEKFDTGIDFNSDIDKVLEDSIYKELIPYHLESEFFRPTPLLSPFATPTFEWTLYSNTSDENTEVTAGAFNYYSEYKDAVPKLCGFDNNANALDDANNSFVFIQGCYKNFDYYSLGQIEGETKYYLWPNIILSDAFEQMEELAGGECYLWQYNWYSTESSERNQNNTNPVIYNTRSTAPMYLPFFSKIQFAEQDEEGLWNYSSNISASWFIAEPLASFADYNNINFIEDYTQTPGVIAAAQDERDLDLSIKVNPVLDDFSNFIYNIYWSNELEDLYDIDGKVIEVTARLNIQPQDALRKFYYFEGCYWIITEIENYNLTDENFNFYKMKLVKVKDINNYIQG